MSYQHYTVYRNYNCVWIFYRVCVLVLIPQITTSNNLSRVGVWNGEEVGSTVVPDYAVGYT